MVDRVLFSVNHPAQVHLFKHAVRELEADGCEVLVASRRKEVTVDLLDEYGIDHVPVTAASGGAVSLVRELCTREAKLAALARRFDPDVVVSRLVPPAVHVSRLLGARNVVFKDTVLHSPLLRTTYHAATLPFVDDLCTPPGFDLCVPFGRHHRVGFQELAYLHPNRFAPDPSNLTAHGVDPDAPFAVVRLAGWDAYHDVGNRGLSAAARRELVSALAERGDVYISSERELPPRYEQYRLSVPVHHVHDLLYYADLYVGDSQTMPTEAALLGTPAVRVNSVVGDGDMQNFVALEAEYGLCFSHADERAAVDRARAIASGEIDADWHARRAALVADERDVTDYMLSLIRADGTAVADDTPDGSDARSQPGPDGAGGDRTGGNRTGADGAGSDGAGGDRTGGDRTGGNRTGGDRTGGNRTGADGAGSDGAGGDEASADGDGLRAPGGESDAA